MIRETRQGTTFTVKITPRAKRDEVVCSEADAIKIRLNAPPVEGRANEALVKFLSRLFGVASTDVEILRGAAARYKLVRVRGASGELVRERLGLKQSKGDD